MPENCESACPGLTRLEQEVVDVRRQNGADHKEIRESIKELEMTAARQAERFDRLMDNQNEMKSDIKTILGQLNPLTNKLDDVDRLNAFAEEIKAKPGKRLDGVVDKILLTVAGALATFVLFKLGLLV